MVDTRNRLMLQEADVQLLLEKLQSLKDTIGETRQTLKQDFADMRGLFPQSQQRQKLSLFSKSLPVVMMDVEDASTADDEENESLSNPVIGSQFQDQLQGSSSNMSVIPEIEIEPSGVEELILPSAIQDDTDSESMKDKGEIMEAEFLQQSIHQSQVFDCMLKRNHNLQRVRKLRLSTKFWLFRFKQKLMQSFCFDQEQKEQPKTVLKGITLRELGMLSLYSSVRQEDWRHELEIYFSTYKNQMLLLGCHGLELQVLSCLKEFGEGSKMGLKQTSEELQRASEHVMCELLRFQKVQDSTLWLLLEKILPEICRVRRAGRCTTHEPHQIASHVWHRWRNKNKILQAHVDLFGSNNWNSTSGKKKLCKDWWFKYKENTMTGAFPAAAVYIGPYKTPYEVYHLQRPPELISLFSVVVLLVF